MISERKTLRDSRVKHAPLFSASLIVVDGLQRLLEDSVHVVLVVCHLRLDDVLHLIERPHNVFHARIYQASCNK